jgi:deoxyribonuclease-2
MVSQEKRGGGTIAFQHDVLCKSLHQADSVVVPPGVKEEDVRAAIKKTHGQ